MRHNDEATTVSEYLLESGECTADTGIIGDLAILVEGHIEIHANDRALAFEIVSFDFCHNCKNYISY